MILTKKVTKWSQALINYFFRQRMFSIRQWSLPEKRKPRQRYGDETAFQWQEREDTPVRLLTSLWTRSSTAVGYNLNKLCLLLQKSWFYFMGEDLAKELFLSHKHLTGRSCNLRLNLVSALSCNTTLIFSWITRSCFGCLCKSVV